MPDSHTHTPRSSPRAHRGESPLGARPGPHSRRAALLANHGLIVIGDTLAHALSLAVEAEQLAKLYLATLATGVRP